MRFFRYAIENGAAIGVMQGDEVFSLASLDPALPRDMAEIAARGHLIVRYVEMLLKRGGTPINLDEARLLVPFPNPGKIICIGLNYQEHATETNIPTTAFPTVFTRFTTTLVDPGASIIRSHVSTAYDYEVELVAVIGKRAHYVNPEDALDHVAGYSVANDVSVRDFQFETSQFTIGKNFDGSCPLGPFFVTADELPAGGKDLAIMTRLNGKTVQSASTSDMIFDVQTLVHKLSQVMSLNPGDIILTGTPSGIGHARDPKLYLKDGDVCECEVKGVGLLRNTVRDEETS